MKIRSLQIQLVWPDKIPVYDLGEYINTFLEKSYDLLRWSIIDVIGNSKKSSCLNRFLILEVIIID